MLPVPRRTYFSYNYCPHESKAASHCFLFGQPPSHHAPLPPQHVYCVEWCSFASLGCPQDDFLLGPLLSNTLCKGAHTLKTSHTLRKQGPLQLPLNLLPASAADCGSPITASGDCSGEAQGDFCVPLEPLLDTAVKCSY